MRTAPELYELGSLKIAAFARRQAKEPFAFVLRVGTWLRICEAIAPLVAGVLEQHWK